jgi:hypothetical protein
MKNAIRAVKIVNDRKPRKSKVKSPIEMTPTCRGFLRGEFTDSNGQSCSIQRSSAFDDEFGGALIWLGVNNVKGNFSVLGHSNAARTRNGGWGWQEKCLSTIYPDSDINVPDRMHLSQKQVKALLPALKHFAKTGELPS